MKIDAADLGLAPQGGFPIDIDRTKFVAALRDLADAFEQNDAILTKIYTGQRASKEDYTERTLLVRYVSRNKG